MKLKFETDLPPERLHLSLPGTVMRDLTLFQRYLREELRQEKDLKQIATTIIETFLAAGDRQFLVWKKGQQSKTGQPEEGTGKDRHGVGNAGISTTTGDPNHV
jgi:hypothetical protein